MSQEILDARLMLAKQHIDDLRLEASRDRLARSGRKHRAGSSAARGRTWLRPAAAR